MDIKQLHSEAVSAIDSLLEAINEKMNELDDQLIDDDENEELQAEYDKYEDVANWLSDCQDHLTNTADELDLNDD